MFEGNAQTFGGEIEMFVGDENGGLATFETERLRSGKESILSGGMLNYDSCKHLLELNLNVVGSLSEILANVRSAVVGVIEGVTLDGKVLINTSTYPRGSYLDAYKNRVDKIVYCLVRGATNEREAEFLTKMGEDYRVRNWKHECSSVFAGIQPWNSIEIDDVEKIFQALYACNFLSKHISANGPYFQGVKTKYTDNRWRMYDRNEGMLSSSIYPEDKNLLDTFPDLDFSLSGYFDRLFKNLNLPFLGNKDGLRAIKKPKPTYDMICDGQVICVDSRTYEEVVIDNFYEEVNFRDLYESAVFFPDFKLRIVGGSDILGEDFRELIHLIRIRDDAGVKKTFHRFDIKVAIEGRNYSTVLPKNGDFTRTLFPFVFQTLIIKNHGAVIEYLNANHIGMHRVQQCNNRVYEDGVREMDREMALGLIRAIFSDLDDYDEVTAGIIFQVKKAIISGITGGGTYYGDDVDSYLRDNLIGKS